MNTICDCCGAEHGDEESCDRATHEHAIPDDRRPLLADRDALMLQLIETALARDVTWASIARTLRLKDKREAKRLHKALQRTAKAQT